MAKSYNGWHAINNAAYVRFMDGTPVQVRILGNYNKELAKNIPVQAESVYGMKLTIGPWEHGPHGWVAAVERFRLPAKRQKKNWA